MRRIPNKNGINHENSLENRVKKRRVVHKTCILDVILGQKFIEFLRICVILVIFVAKKQIMSTIYGN